MNLKEILDKEVEKRDSFFEVSDEKPDPILIAREKKDEKISLICALFAYGNAKQIVKFLKGLDFELLNEKDEVIKKELKDKYYRFQNHQDVINIFLTLKRIDSIEDIFFKGYKKENYVIDGIREVLLEFERVNNYTSKGYKFLIGNIPPQKTAGVSPYKRWNMFLRWMVREDNIDFGLWKKVDKKDLIIPLDTHTFNVSRKLGLLDRKTYDLKSAILLTEKLKEFDKYDPVKYDFALYRIGQERIIDEMDKM